MSQPLTEEEAAEKYRKDALEMLEGYGFSSAPGLAVTDTLAISIASMITASRTDLARKMIECVENNPSVTRMHVFASYLREVAKSEGVEL